MKISTSDLERILNPSQRDPQLEERRQATLARLRAQQENTKNPRPAKVASD